MFVRICVLLLSLGLSSCQLGPIASLGIRVATDAAISISPFNNSTSRNYSIREKQTYGTNNPDGNTGFSWEEKKNEGPVSVIATPSPLLCTQDGVECKVITQNQASKLVLLKACEPSDDTDCWYYKEPNT